MKITVVVLLSILIGGSPLFALEHQINVVRKGGNLYWAEVEKIYIQTEYCLESSSTATALLQMEGDSGEITFSASGLKCDVKIIYGHTQLDAGEYLIKVSREDDNWYGLVAKNMALKTNGCFSLVDDMQARLQINEDGTGTLFLSEADEECLVEGVYSKGELQKKQ